MGVMIQCQPSEIASLEMDHNLQVSKELRMIARPCLLESQELESCYPHKSYNRNGFRHILIESQGDNRRWFQLDDTLVPHQHCVTFVVVVAFAESGSDLIRLNGKRRTMTQSGRGVTVETQAKVGTSKTANPFADIKTSDLEKYAGFVIAVDMTTRQIVASAMTAEGLKEKMKQEYRGVKYARVAIPKLKSPAQ